MNNYDKYFLLAIDCGQILIVLIIAYKALDNIESNLALNIVKNIGYIACPTFLVSP